MMREGYLDKNKNPFYEFEPEKAPPTDNNI